MKVYFLPGDEGRIRRRPRAVAIGIFDGVHLGHRKIIAKITRRRGEVPAVVTFDPHPGKILHPKEFHPTILMSLDHRLKVLGSLGVREVFVIRFNRRFSKISHGYFLKNTLLDRLGARFFSVGDDFRFGYRGLGDRKYLESKSRKSGFRVSVARPFLFEKEPISSTRIRRMIERGDLVRAKRMLGRTVSVYGTVVRGRGRGKKLGFPTANLNPHHEALPPAGVYAARGFLGTRPLKGVIHIGARPTFKDRLRSMEVHFFDFHKNIYGRDLELLFIARLRPIERFSHPRYLAEAIRHDTAMAKRILA